MQFAVLNSVLKPPPHSGPPFFTASSFLNLHSQYNANSMLNRSPAFQPRMFTGSRFVATFDCRPIGVYALCAAPGEVFSRVVERVNFLINRLIGNPGRRDSVWWRIAPGVVGGK